MIHVFVVVNFSFLVLCLLNGEFKVNGDVYRQNVQFDYRLLLDGTTP